MQNKTLIENEKEKEKKDEEIKELKSKINIYINNLKDNEKLLEENKKMILYLNQSINDITNAPFKSRTLKQQEFINKYNNVNNMTGTLFQDRDKLNKFIN